MFGRNDSLSNALAIANYKFYWLNLAFCPHNFFSCIFFFSKRFFVVWCFISGPYILCYCSIATSCMETYVVMRRFSR